MSEVVYFHWADYLVFGLFLVLSTLVGAFFGFRDRKKMTSKNFLTGGGNMHWAVVALSMQASFLSAIFILSIPVEVYAWGTMYYYLVISYFIAIPFAGHFFMPIYYKLKLTSAYEYLERRFDKKVRTACAITFFVQILLYMSVVLYTPALALNQVTGLAVPLAIVLCGLVCTIYTALGGMKATVWNDFIQMIIIASTLVCVIAIAVSKIGGMSRVWEINYNGSRITFDDFRLDPRLRSTFWTQAVGGIFISLAMYASNQTTIQKFISVKTLRGAKKSIWMATCTSALFLTLVCLTGMVTYGYYWDCDPLLEGRIDRYDQIVPLLVMDVMGDLHGLPGLFIAAAFSAALSSLSGSLSALTAVALTDFIGPLYLKFKEKPLGELYKARLSRILTLSFGVLVTGLGFAAQYFGDVLVQVAFSIFGFVGGPLTCVIGLGMFVPFVNSTGAICGLIASLLVTSWIAVGSILAKVTDEMLPLGTEGCPAAGNRSSIDPFTTMIPVTVTPRPDSVLMSIYDISNMYYGWIALIVSLLVTIPVSLITGRTKVIDPRLVVNWHQDCCCCCPGAVESCLRCGTEYDTEVVSIKDEEPLSCVNEHANVVFDENNEISIKVSPPTYEDSVHDKILPTNHYTNPAFDGQQSEVVMTAQPTSKTPDEGYFKPTTSAKTPPPESHQGGGEAPGEDKTFTIRRPSKRGNGEHHPEASNDSVSLQSAETKF